MEFFFTLLLFVHSHSLSFRLLIIFEGHLPYIHRNRLSHTNTQYMCTSRCLLAKNIVFVYIYKKKRTLWIIPNNMQNMCLYFFSIGINLVWEQKRGEVHIHCRTCIKGINRCWKIDRYGKIGDWNFLHSTIEFNNKHSIFQHDFKKTSSIDSLHINTAVGKITSVSYLTFQFCICTLGMK